MNAGVNVAFSSQYSPYVTTFLFRVKGTCGWSDWSAGHYYMAQSCNYYNYTIYPNPTSETLYIEKQQNEQKENINLFNLNDFGELDYYELYDFNAKLISEGEMKYPHLLGQLSC